MSLYRRISIPKRYGMDKYRRICRCIVRFLYQKGDDTNRRIRTLYCRFLTMDVLHVYITHVKVIKHNKNVMINSAKLTTSHLRIMFFGILTIIHHITELECRSMVIKT